MPVTKDAPAPYTPPSAILLLIDRHRQRGLPSPIDGEVLGRAGISQSLIPRTLQALQSLDLIDEQMRPTPVLEGLRLASEADYKNRLSDWLHATYADALSFIDPATADETHIRDAFRSYKPIGQQARMVSLFMGLFEAAGVMQERKRQRSQTSPTRNGSVRRQAPKPASQITKNDSDRRDQHPKHTNIHVPSLPPAVAGLLASLPAQGDTWSKPERDRFMHTFGAVLDFCFPTNKAPAKAEASQNPSQPGDQTGAD